MAIVQESWYSGAYYDPDTGVTVSLGADNQGRELASHTGEWGSPSDSWYISFPFKNYTVYRYARTSTARNGTQFYWNDTGHGNPELAGRSTASLYYKYTGTRTVTVVCGSYGRLSSPSIGSDSEAVSMAVLSFTDRGAHPNCYTCVAAPPPNSGTLLSRGLTHPHSRGGRGITKSRVVQHLLSCRS